MKSGKNIDKNIQDLNTENQAAQLAVIAGLISTLGDGLATIAAALALQEIEKSNQNTNNSNANLDLQNLQMRIDILEKEMKQIKKILQNKKT
ncbi:hypothetical protein [Lysinibacillus sp. SGAir0095]|uniref:hypothetical protein n=1 Tax=Lysinibacillus sp. SGAir0095 TaxID=2070463 RepID=UPI0010CD3932|nr:hypothetical protein [Lysinibacillus sp. SGAir0095]QCR30776.1 hypothetical protein C1N55_00520 [Lysinibacillus sp. SGAir0095]